MIYGFQDTGQQTVKILKIREINLASSVMSYSHLNLKRAALREGQDQNAGRQNLMGPGGLLWRIS